MSLAGHFAALTSEIILLLGMIFIALLRWTRPRMRPYAPWFGAGAALLAAWHAAAWVELPAVMPAHATLRLDLWSALGRIMIYLTVGVSLWAMERGEAAALHDKRPLDRTLLILLGALGAGLLTAAQDHLVVILGLAAIILPAAALAYAAGDRAAAERIFVVAFAGFGLMLFGLALLLAERGHARFALLEVTRARMMIGWLLNALGLLLFAGVVPFHAGLDDLRRGAPASVPACLAVALLVGAGLALGRFIFWSQPGSPELIKALSAFAAATIFLGFAPALVERAPGRIFHSFVLGHAGLLLLGATVSLAARDAHGLAALLVSLIALAPALLAWRVAMDAVGGDGGLRGMGRVDPLAAAALAVIFLSLAGLAPTLGFMARWRLFAATFQAGQVGLLAIAAFNTLFAAVAAARLGSELSRSDGAPPRLGGASRALVLAAAFFLLLAGLLPDAILDLASRAAMDLIP